MPQLKSSAKRLRQSQKKAERNKTVKNNLDYLLRHFKKALDTRDEKTAADLSQKLIKAIDKAAQKNVFKKNTAARKKSRMIKKLNALGKKQ